MQSLVFLTFLGDNDKLINEEEFNDKIFWVEFNLASSV